MSGARTAVVLFTCDPRIEAARKPFVGGRSAAVHAALLADTAMRVRASAWDLVFAWRGEETRAWGLRPTAVVQQRGRSFGERLMYAASDVAALGYTRLVLVGADCPSLEARDIHEAVGRLDQVDVVLGPATDGGVNLIAFASGLLAKMSLRELPWGSDALHARLAAELTGSGLTTAQIPEREDVDTVEVLARVLRAAPNSRLNRLIERGTASSQVGRLPLPEAPRTPLVLFGPSFLKSPPEGSA